MKQLCEVWNGEINNNNETMKLLHNVVSKMEVFAMGEYQQHLG